MAEPPSRDPDRAGVSLRGLPQVDGAAAHPPGARRLRPLALAVAVSVASAAALVAGTPRLLLRLGAPTMARAGCLTPAWTARAAFVRPGVAVALPASGRLLGLSRAGLVAAGAQLAEFEPAARPTPPAGFTGSLRRLGVAPTAAVAAGPSAALLCLRPTCAAPALPPPAPAPAAAGVTARGSGWFSPGWDPLAALPPAAYSDLPPWAVLQPAAPAPLPGTPLAGGVPLGSLGAPWSGYWLCDLPAGAAPLLAGAATATILWPGGAASMPVRPAGSGPAVAGRVVGIFAAAALGPDPGPPARATVVVRLPAVSGEVVPATALFAPRAGSAAVAVLSAGRRLRRQRVRVMAVVGRRAVVAGLRPGTLVLAHPGRYPGARAGGA